MNRRSACGAWWILCTIERRTVASSRSCCPRLNIIARLETFWKAAFRSNATKTRDWSASAMYCMDLIILLAPSWHPTPCWSAPATAMTDGFFGCDDRFECEPA